MRTLQAGLNQMFGRPRQPRAPDLDRSERAAFKRLAAEHGLTYRKARDGYLEIDPCAAFPEGLTTAFHGWGDALARVQSCLANPALVSGGEYVPA